MANADLLMQHTLGVMGGMGGMGVMCAAHSLSSCCPSVPLANPHLPMLRLFQSQSIWSSVQLLLCPFAQVISLPAQVME
jgi:hypothetical protein